MIKPRDTQAIVAAFSIDEHIRWATAKVIGNDIDQSSITFAEGDEVQRTRPGAIADQVANYVAKVSKNHSDIRRATAIGISSIGVVDVAEKSVARVLRKGWTSAMAFDELFPPGTHLAVQNDATCAALAEWEFRQNKQNNDGLWVYITINTGINCGIVSRPLFQYRHPEIGHNYPARHPDDPFDPKNHESGCPEHIWCFEGMASGDSMQKRWGDDWDADERAWHLEAFYVGQICLSATLNFRPDKLILGGYVTRKNPEFLPMVRAEFAALNKDYIKVDDLETYIVAGQFDDKVNVLGALVLALDAVAPRRLSVVDQGGRHP